MKHSALPWRDQDTIYVGHCMNVLRSMPAESVHCCVTSIPYWGLRAYGTEPQLWGGDPSHEHNFATIRGAGSRSSDTKPGQHQGKGTLDRDQRFAGMCSCGAWRGELGLEPTPEMFVQHIVEVFVEVRRVLRRDGTCFLNVGDSYAATGKSGGGKQGEAWADHGADYVGPKGGKWSPAPDGLKPKDLCMIPARLALAMQADGWWLRSDICWAKKSAMPESVTDRPTCAWEHIFLFTKSAKYFYDSEAVKEECASNQCSGNGFKRDARLKYGGRGNPTPWTPTSRGANLRNFWMLGDESVRLRQDLTAEELQDFARFFEPIPNGGASDLWLLGPQPFPGAHFATFPTEVPRRAILAGTSEHGCCSECGAPWKRITKPSTAYAEHLGKDWADDAADSVEGRGHFAMGDGRSATQRRVKRNAASLTAEYETVGWEPTCNHTDAPVVPCTVLDPFSGAATSGLVARRHGRAYVGIELNPNYAEMSWKRCCQDPQMFNPRRIEVFPAIQPQEVSA